MIPDALDFILRPVTDEQAEYAAAHRTPASLAPSLQGEAGPDSSDADAVGAPASEVQTCEGAHGKPNREAGERPSAPGNDDGVTLAGTPTASSSSPLGSASTTPRWSAVDDDTADLLSLVANTESALPEPERQWQHFLSVMRQVARRDMLGLFIDQNEARVLLRGEVSPSRIGAFYNRAARQGLMRPAGWNRSTDTASRNGGKPQNTWEWLGT